MAANTTPIYSLRGHIDSSSNNNSGTIVGPSANTAQDGSGSNIYQVFQAGTEGSYVQKVRLRSVGSPAATVARFYICSATGAGAFTGGTTNTATNTWLIDETPLSAVTLSQTAASPFVEIPLGYVLPGGSGGGYRLLVSFGTSTGSAGTGYQVTAFGGDY